MQLQNYLQRDLRVGQEKRITPLKSWSGREDLNLRPPGPESSQGHFYNAIPDASNNCLRMNALRVTFCSVLLVVSKRFMCSYEIDFRNAVLEVVRRRTAASCAAIANAGRESDSSPGCIGFVDRSTSTPDLPAAAAAGDSMATMGASRR